MDMQTDSPPSGLSAFLRGFGSGVFSGAIMMGIVTGLTVIFGGAFVGLPTFALMTTATGLFTGLMAAKRAVFDAPLHPHGPTRFETSIIPVAAPALAAPAPAVPIFSALPDAAPEQAPAKNWADKANRDGSAASRIEQIINNGSLADKDRATAILAAREAADASPVRA